MTDLARRLPMIETPVGASGAELLRVEGLEVQHAIHANMAWRGRGRKVHAVDDLDLTVVRGETLGLVGESGCGKSTLARAIVGLARATSGRIVFEGVDVTAASGREMRNLRRHVQLVFQDPYRSLNPRMNVGDLIAEPLINFRISDPREARAKTMEMLSLVGLSDVYAKRLPHQLSGGQRQRVGIARALIVKPKLLLLDEPVSALDVSIQAQLLNLLQDLQQELDLTYIMIAHDLAVVRHMAHRVAVMYLGKIVELATNQQIYSAPAHPYTKALLSSIPIPDPHRRAEGHRIQIDGELPDPTDPPSGCRFRTRCWKATELCSSEVPGLVLRPGVDHPTACHFAITGPEEAATRLLAK